MLGLNRPTVLLLSGILLTPACSPSASPGQARKPAAASSSAAPASSACPAPDFIAAQPIRHINLAPERGPVEDLGGEGDLIWTWPDPRIQPGRSIAVELNRGKTHPYRISQHRGRPVTVRGFPATIDEIEDGYGLLWNEGTHACSHYSLAAYGMSEEETLQFANGLRDAADSSGRSGSSSAP